jgi:hypothetical protein
MTIDPEVSCTTHVNDSSTVREAFDSRILSSVLALDVIDAVDDTGLYGPSGGLPKTGKTLDGPRGNISHNYVLRLLYLKYPSAVMAVSRDDDRSLVLVTTWTRCIL